MGGSGLTYEIILNNIQNTHAGQELPLNSCKSMQHAYEHADTSDHQNTRPFQFRGFLC